MDLNFSGARMADMFDEYCDIAHLDEPKVAMAWFSKKAVSQGLKGHAALSGLRTLKSQLDSNQQLMLDSCLFALFYQFVFFICCEPGQNNLAGPIESFRWLGELVLILWTWHTKIGKALSTAIEAWRFVLAGKFRLLDQWCDFVQKHSQYSISKDTWQQLLEFTQREPINLKGYDRNGSWPLLLDAFVSDMHRKSGFSNYTHISNASVFPGLRLSIGHKRSYSTEEDTESDTANYISERPEEIPNSLCSKRSRLTSKCLTKWNQ